ncbi:NAD(P)H-dependent oxidoreductase [Chitinasiproducens palmae]|nr:homoserine dehydrogenase [Chitinasiproducens palmae]
MNYQHLFGELNGKTISMALVGPKGGFGRSLLAQCRQIKSLRVAALCDLDIDGTLATLEQLGYPVNDVKVCTDEHAVRAAAAAGATVLISDFRLLDAVPCDIVVEATGHPETSVQIAKRAIERGVHVAMATKETDSVAGPYLNRLAVEHGVVYTTPDGDQPSNLINLVTWARVLGFDVVAAGKSSEYDYLFDPQTSTVHYAGQQQAAPGLADTWSLEAVQRNARAVLAARREALAGLPLSATPDYCEMNVVANSTGLVPAVDTLNYPICRPAELAEVFVPVEDGGILTRTGIVDVFNCLRRPDETSFAGGVFVVVRCNDAATWTLLREKGHLVSQSGKYACIYTPFHLMGIETPISLFSAVLHKRSSGSAEQARHAVMVARAERDWHAGETLVMGGHHHTIDGIAPLLRPTAEAHGLAPFYLAANKRLVRDVKQGDVVPIDAVEIGESVLADAWRLGAA